MSEARQLAALRALETNPQLTQRELAKVLGVSLGAANYCLKALAEKGWIKIENFQKSPRKLRYLYLLTPVGIKARTQLTANFLKRKLLEYELIQEEISRLRIELDNR